MVGLEEHFLPGATILSGVGVTLAQGSPFLVILVPPVVLQVPLNQYHMELT